ncbi:hypothetical protein KAR91_78450 [Candidatus Pacearchaeota archaeon]|nr:hypothetical protein [Candidatus Pacearchaeota archaeon]
MVIIEFVNQMFEEIPEQDNPAFNCYENPGNFEHDRPEECILICKVSPYRSGGVGENGFTVFHVPLDGGVVAKCLTWNIEIARLLAKTLST